MVEKQNAFDQVSQGRGFRAERKEADGATQDQQLRHLHARRNGSEARRLREVDDGLERRGGGAV
jgi:hypothetical protein